MNDSPRIGFIGAGRLGSALAVALQHAGLPIHAVASARAESARHMAARLPGCEAVSAQEVAERCDLVFITTPLLAEAAHVWATWGASEADTVRALLPLARGGIDAATAERLHHILGAAAESEKSS